MKLIIPTYTSNLSQLCIIDVETNINVKLVA